MPTIRNQFEVIAQVSVQPSIKPRRGRCAERLISMYLCVQALQQVKGND